MTNTINLKPLVELVSVGIEDDLAKYKNISPNVQKALKRKLEENEEKVADRAAEEIIKLLNLADAICDQKVDQIRNIRRQEARLKRELESITKAKVLAEEQSNFLPLAFLLGIPEQAFLNVMSKDEFRKLSKLDSTHE